MEKSGCDSNIGYHTLDTFGCCSKKWATFKALAVCWGTRSANVLSPLNNNQESIGPAIPPRFFRYKASLCSSAKVLEQVNTPPNEVPCPPMYLVEE